jgi:endonuclease VIII
MPEGHTLYRLATGLRATFGGNTVRASSPQGRFAHGAEIIDGRILETAESAGKHLFVQFDNDAIVHVHLGLYGTWPIADLPAPEPVGALRLRLVGTTSYADLRGPTQCELLDELGKDKVLARLGPDPLREHADSALAYARIRSSSRPIGALLMDQSVLAGVGNVYRAEVLFRARLHPLESHQTSLERNVARPRDPDEGRRNGRLHRHCSAGARSAGDGTRTSQRRPPRRGVRLPTP